MLFLNLFYFAFFVVFLVLFLINTFSPTHTQNLTDSDTNSSVDHFWPPPYGVIRTPYEQWLDQAENANFIVAILKLSEEYQSQFDEKKATSWFETVQGSPYGWHNFVYTFLDTMVCFFCFVFCFFLVFVRVVFIKSKMMSISWALLS